MIFSNLIPPSTANEDDFIGFKDEDAIRRAKDAYRQKQHRTAKGGREFWKSETEWTTESGNPSLEEADDLLVTAKTMLDETFVALENSVTNGILTESELQTLRTTVKTEQDAISSDLETVRSQEQNISGAVLDIEQQMFEKTKRNWYRKRNVDAAKMPFEIARRSLESTKTEVSANASQSKRSVENSEK